MTVIFLPRPSHIEPKWTCSQARFTLVANRTANAFAVHWTGQVKITPLYIVLLLLLLPILTPAFHIPKPNFCLYTHGGNADWNECKSVFCRRVGRWKTADVQCTVVLGTQPANKHSSYDAVLHCYDTRRLPARRRVYKICRASEGEEERVNPRQLEPWRKSVTDGTALWHTVPPLNSLDKCFQAIAGCCQSLLVIYYANGQHRTQKKHMRQTCTET